VRVVALAISGSVFLGRHLRIIQPVRGRKPITPREMSFHVLKFENF